MSRPVPAAVVRWHEVVDCEDAARREDLMAALLADEVTFCSPALHTPQEGREKTSTYLRAAMLVLGPTLRYERELYADDSAVLEFRAEVGGMAVHGVDFLCWDADDRLVDFTVMVRPVKGLQALMEQMGAELSRSAGQG